MPDFYISSSDHKSLKMPRGCLIKQKVTSLHKGNPSMMLIEISPSLERDESENQITAVSELVISPRRTMDSLYPLSDWPIIVNVAFPVQAIKKIDSRYVLKTDIGDFHFAVIGGLHPTYIDAIEKIIGY